MKKTKLKNYFKTGILYFGIPFLLWNCESENLNTGQKAMVETVPVHEAIDFFTVKTASRSAKSTGEAYVIPHLGHISQEEIINSDALLTVIPATTIYEAHYSRILLLKINNEIQSLVFSMHTSDVNTQYFTGEILITNLQGDFLNGYRVENGQFVSQFRKKPGSGNVAAKTGNAVCPQHGECTAESDCILCLQELEEVVVTAEAGGSGDYIDIYVGLNDFPGIDEGGADGPDMDLDWDYGPGEGSSPDNDESPCPEGYIKNNNGICVEDDKIINELTGKEKCVNDLLDETGNSYVKDILSKFEGDSEFDIKIESQDKVVSEVTGEEINGKTYKPINGIIAIQISTSKAIGRPVLDVARTILHEYIHADMYRKLYTKYPASGDLDFKQTYEKYQQGNFNATPQHETMAALYVGEMTNALKNFHQNALAEDYNYLTNNGTDPLPDSFYEALAWLGLKEHDVQAYIDLSDEKKATLENNLIIYYPGTTKDCPEN